LEYTITYAMTSIFAFSYSHICSAILIETTTVLIYPAGMGSEKKT